MLDHAFRRRREIERMLLSGKKLTIAELMGRYSVGRKSISRNFEVIGEELPVVSRQGYNGGYFLMDGVSKNQNLLSQEQLECLERTAGLCTEKDRKRREVRHGHSTPENRNHRHFIRKRSCDNGGACMGTGSFKAHDNERHHFTVL